jgi:hypothetical protein
LSWIAAALLIALGLHLWFLWQRSRRTAARHLSDMEAAITSAIEEARLEAATTVGVETFTGRHEGLRVQVRTIVDTLAVRKLPALWLSVTVTEPVEIDATYDIMMRPAAPSTFSNFDRLPHRLRTPPGFPAEAILRSDRAGAAEPLARLWAKAELFSHPAAKELLITPNGVRIVWLLAEADRARYGVFRQAVFDAPSIDPDLVRRLCAAAAGIRDTLNRERVAA